MWAYGNDKPDIRFGMKICNLKFPQHSFPGKKNIFWLLEGANFQVFEGAETVVAIAVPGSSETSRKELDSLTDWVKRPQIGMKGLVYIRYNTDGSLKSSVDKFYSEEKLKAIANEMDAKPGDLILILAGAEERTRKAISELRLEMGKTKGYRKETSLNSYGYWIFRFLNMRKKKIAGWHVTTLLRHLSQIILIS